MAAFCVCDAMHQGNTTHFDSVLHGLAGCKRYAFFRHQIHSLTYFNIYLFYRAQFGAARARFYFARKQTVQSIFSCI